MIFFLNLNILKLLSQDPYFLNFETSSIRFSDVIYPHFDPKINFIPFWRQILLIFEQISLLQVVELNVSENKHTPLQF